MRATMLCLWMVAAIRSVWLTVHPMRAWRKISGLTSSLCSSSSVLPSKSGAVACDNGGRLCTAHHNGNTSLGRVVAGPHPRTVVLAEFRQLVKSGVDRLLGPGSGYTNPQGPPLPAQLLFSHPGQPDSVLQGPRFKHLDTIRYLGLEPTNKILTRAFWVQPWTRLPKIFRLLLIVSE